jgi:hypothetical protein
MSGNNNDDEHFRIHGHTSPGSNDQRNIVENDSDHPDTNVAETGNQENKTNTNTHIDESSCSNQQSIEDVDNGQNVRRLPQADEFKSESVLSIQQQEEHMEISNSDESTNAGNIHSPFKGTHIGHGGDTFNNEVNEENNDESMHTDEPNNGINPPVRGVVNDQDKEGNSQEGGDIYKTPPSNYLYNCVSSFFFLDNNCM